MKKLLTILGMVLLAAAFVAPDNAQAQTPSPLSPVDGFQATVNSTGAVTFKWTSILFADNYRLEIADNSNFSSPVYSATLGNVTSKTITSLKPGVTYYWHVCARIFFNWGKYSGAPYFRIVIPELLSPATGVTDQIQPLTLTWRPIDYYTDKIAGRGQKLEIDNNSDFSSIVKFAFGLDDSYTASGLNFNTKYYWRVCYYTYVVTEFFPFKKYTYYNYSSIRNFTTCTNLAAPGLVSPSNGDVDMSLPVNFDWNDVTGADLYKIQIDDNSNFSSPVIDEEPSASQFQVQSGLSNGTVYYWRVQTKNYCAWSDWSLSRNFTMGCPIPGLPTLELPADGAADLPQPIHLDWADAAGATIYRLQVDDDAGFGNPVKDNLRIYSHFSYADLNTDGTRYYWRVASGNDCGSWSGWSSIRNFTTECVVLGPPTLSGPPDEEGLDVREPVVLTWGDVAGATDYDVRVSDDEMFNNIIAENIHASSGYTIQYPLQAGVWYYWEVRTNNACGDGDWSDTWEFQPNCPTAGVTTLESPSDGALSVLQPVELNWSDVAEATKYNVQVDNDADFSSEDVNNENVAASTLTLPNLLEGISYYWRIRAYNGCQWGDWSSVWNFVAGEQTDIEIVTRDEIPESFMLKQNYPNPFNPSTTIEFALPRAAYVTLNIHNILGGKVETLVSRPMSAGSYSVIWDASSIPSGVYFYKIEAGTFSETKKMTLIK